MAIIDCMTGEVREETPEELEALIPSLEDAQAAFSSERSARLAATDWWAIRASETGVPMTDQQLAYRAELRSMDDVEGFDPRNPVWPEKPE